MYLFNHSKIWAAGVVFWLLLANFASAKVKLETLNDSASIGSHLSISQDGRMVSYYDQGNKNLKLATCTEACETANPAWQIVTVDNDNDVGFRSSIQRTSSGNPVIAYYDWDNERLKLATCTANCESATPTWQYAVVDDQADVGVYLSLQLDAEDRPVIAYYDYTNEILRVAICLDNCDSGSPSWQLGVVDDGGDEEADVGMYASLQLDSSDRPVIAYHDYDYGILQIAKCLNHCRSDNPQWEIQYLDGFNEGENDVGAYASLQLDSQDRPVISYHDYDENTIKLATCTHDCDEAGSSWHWRKVETADYHGRSDLRLDSQDRPIISYFGPSGEQLRLVSCEGDCDQESPDWAVTLMDEGLAQRSSSLLSLGDNGFSRVFYVPKNQDTLKTATLISPASVSYVLTPADDQYITHNWMSFSVVFDQPMNVSGDLSLLVKMDSGNVNAAYVSGQGSRTLTFRHVVTAADYDADGIDIVSLVYGDGTTLRDVYGNAADPTLRWVESTSGIRVNKSSYTVSVLQGGAGEVTPTTSQVVNRNESTTYSIQPQSGFETVISGNCHVETTSGASDNAVTATVSNVLNDCRLVVSFISESDIPFVEDDEYRASQALVQINTAPAYLRGLSGKNHKVGVIDSGIYRDAVDFYGMDILSQNFVPSETDTQRINRHGTQVSGLIAARRNGIGIQGVAYEADLVVARSLSSGLPNPDAISQGLQMMKNSQVPIINNSWGTGVTIDDSSETPDIAALESWIDEKGYWPIFNGVREAVNNDVVMVFAAGNDSQSSPGILAGLRYFYPDLPKNFITVANVDSNNEIAPSSNRCGVAAPWCVSAPGVQLNTPWNEDAPGLVDESWYTASNNRMAAAQFTGTSASAPLVTGLAVLLKEQFPWMTGEQIVSTILTTASQGVTENFSAITGRGVINVERAIDGPAAFESEFQANIQGIDTEFANDISGTGQLIKSGQGKLTLSGNNTFTGSTSVSEGELHISGALSSAVEINGGRLSGTGRTGAITVTDGTLAPGASAGTLSTGDLVLSEASQLEFELSRAGIAGQGINDLVAVQGDLTLDGQLYLLDSSALQPGTYTLFTYSGELTNQGLGVAQALPGMELSIVAENGVVALHITQVVIETPDTPDVIAGETANDGTLNDPVIGQNGSVEGGTLTGNIQNQGVIQNVTLGQGAQVSGGRVSGEVVGNSNQPAHLNNTTISSGARLENVVIGGDTTLEPGVELGPNVKFDVDANIPAGLDLTGALTKVDWQGGEQLSLVDLNDDVIDPDSEPDARSLIQSIQLLNDLTELDASVSQQSGSGELLVVTESTRSAVLPVQVHMANPDDEEGTFINEDGDVVLVTANRRVIITYPALQGSEVFDDFAASLGLQLAYGDRANLILGPPTDNTAPLSDGTRSISAATQMLTYFSARPDVIAARVNDSSGVGVKTQFVPGLKNVTAFSVVFESGQGHLMEQKLHPVPANWPLMKSSLLNEFEFDEVRIRTDGVISVRAGDQQLQARSGYEVSRDALGAAESDKVVFKPAGDLNGDGSTDFMMIYPNGDRQVLWIYP